MVDEERDATEPSFAELFEANPVTPQKGFQPGDTVTGEVVKTTGDSIFIELGGKSEGVVDAVEFLDEEGNLTVGVGDRVELRVVSVADVITLSRSLKVKGAQAMEMLQDARESGMPVEGRVAAVNKGGFEVEISGVRAFCPVSQIELGYCEKPEDHVGERYSFRIVEFKDRGRNVVVSRRALLEEEREIQARQTLASLEPGQEREGTVTRLADFGAFVDLGGVEGMVHISEMAHYRLRHPSELVGVGQAVRVRVNAYEPSAEGRPRIALSMKALEPTPWEKGLGLREGEIVRGRVVRIKDFGAFVELAPGVDGLVHLSEIAYERVSHPGKVLQEGEEVEVRVLEIDQDRQRISLSIKEAQAVGAADAGRATDVPAGASVAVGARLQGVVDRVVQRGLLVRLPSAGPGVRGYLPQEDLGVEGKAGLRRSFPPGSSVEVAVAAVEEGGRIRLSRRSLQETEERESYRRHAEKQGSTGALATFGDLFKDLKLPPKDG